MNWTEYRMRRLRKLWEVDKMPTAQIAQEFGTTKNAIIGKAHRMWLTPRPSPIKPGSGKPKVIGRPVRKKLAPRADTLDELMPEVVHVALPPGPRVTQAWQKIGAARTCQWPMSDGKPWRFCDDTSAPGSSYCAVHRRLAFVGRDYEPIAHRVGF